jgi:hypothetical protein
MGMQAQAQEKQGQVYYDADTDSYYTQPYQQSNSIFSPFGIMKKAAERNYINNFANRSMTARPEQQYNTIDIASLFPELYQSAQGMQGDSQMSTGLLGGQGAAQSASSGAGRFM